jgi:hypothetical protein
MGIIRIGETHVSMKVDSNVRSRSGDAEAS